MIYHDFSWLTLKNTMFGAGVLLIIAHVLALVKARAVQDWLRKFPRNREAGVVLSLVAGGWFFFLVRVMDLGDFDPWRNTVLIATPIAAALAIYFIPEFLAVRALGACALLVAEPLLESAGVALTPPKAHQQPGGACECVVQSGAPIARHGSHHHSA
jgi:hypothetical protein